MKVRSRNKPVVQGHYVYAKDKVRLQAFRSSSDLKVEIRKIIQKRLQDCWHFCGLKTCGALISLCFHRTLELASEESTDCHCMNCA